MRFASVAPYVQFDSGKGEGVVVGHHNGFFRRGEAQDPDVVGAVAVHGLQVVYAQGRIERDDDADAVVAPVENGDRVAGLQARFPIQGRISQDSVSDPLHDPLVEVSQDDPVEGQDEFSCRVGGELAAGLDGVCVTHDVEAAQFFRIDGRLSGDDEIDRVVDVLAGEDGSVFEDGYAARISAGHRDTPN